MTISLSQNPDTKDKLDGSPAAAGDFMESMDTFGDGTSFEDIMKERSRLRKEREDYNMAELKVQISQLEQALAAETKRRVDATTALDDSARQQIYEMEQRLRQQLEDDDKRLHERLSKIEARLEELDERWQRESTQQLESIETKGEEFSQALEKLRREQDTERKARRAREGRLLKQVEDHTKEFEHRWNAERHERIDQVTKLEYQVERLKSASDHEQINFQKRVSDELVALQREIDQEASERQAQDEEIVSALNRYTQQLQQSLSILSSD